MKPQSEAFPWPQVMSFGLGRLQMAPKDFWAMSLPELNAALRVYYPDTNHAPSRRDLNELMQNHPDLQREPA